MSTLTGTAQKALGNIAPKLAEVTDAVLFGDILLLRHNVKIPALAAWAHSEAASQSDDQRQPQ